MANDQDTTGLSQLDVLSRDLEHAMEEEVGPEVVVNLSGQREDGEGWNHVNVRIRHPDEGIEFERDYEGFPRMSTILEDFHDVH